jgi:hypothetical protein
VGLVVFFEFLRQIGYSEAVSKHLPFRLTSPNAIDPVESFIAFSVVAVALHFAHTSLLRADVALHALLEIARFPVVDTVRNLFKRFGQGQCQCFFSGLWIGSSNGFRNVRRDTVWTWIRRCSSVMGDSRVRSVDSTHASMDGPRIIRWWRC